jgi:hypothetical protein
MNPESYTVGVGIVVFVVAILLYDIYLEQDDVKRNTYSEVLRKWYDGRAWLYYLTAMVLGIVMAHWGTK